jgi:hypothetical protein
VNIPHHDFFFHVEYRIDQRKVFELEPTTSRLKILVVVLLFSTLYVFTIAFLRLYNPLYIGDRDENTLLHIACFHRIEDIIQLLLVCFCATGFGFFCCLLILLLLQLLFITSCCYSSTQKNGADPNAQTIKGATAMHIIVSEQD